MYTNTDCTLYLYRKDGRVERYTRVSIEGVFWDDVEQSSFMRTGQRDTCSVFLVIPLESLKDPIKFTKGKDLVVKGIIDDEIDCTSHEAMSVSLAALKDTHKYVVVTTVDEKLFGSEYLQHYELSCK